MNRLNEWRTAFNNLSKKQQVFYCLFGAYCVYKFIKLCNRISINCELKHTPELSLYKQKPPKYLFPNYFVNDDGLWIYFRKFETNNPKGIIILCHGLAEHIGRYEHIAKFFNKNGYNVYGMDHQGHGRSHGDRCHVVKFDYYIRDLIKFSKMVKDEFDTNNLPIFLLGHSLGGLIATKCGFIDQEEELNLYNGGLILSSPAFGAGKGVKPNPNSLIIQNILKFFAFLFPKFRLVGLDNQNLSHNKSILYHCLNDQLHFNGLCTAGFGKEAQGFQIDLWSNIKNINFPFYVFVGSNDRLISVDKVKLFFKNTKTKQNDKKYKIFDGLLHETLNEREDDQKIVVKELINYCDERLNQLELQS